MPAATRRRVGEEEGFGLIEVVVSAALLVVVVLALLAGIDGPAQTAAANQQRSIATALAQQDQDRMRAMRTSELADYAPPPRQQAVGGVNYTIVSAGTWQKDQSGTASCTNNSAVVQYLDLTTTVTWPAMKGPPLTVESIAAPENGAFNLIGQIQDEAGAAVSGLPIQAQGPSGSTRITNSFGCAAWGHMTAGPYNLIFNRANWVDPDGDQNVTMTATVSPGTTTTKSHLYAQGVPVNVSFDTKVGAVTSKVNGRTATFTNSGMTRGPRVFSAPGGQDTSTTPLATPLLFPFTTGYGVYAGGCADNEPTQYLVATGTTVATPYNASPTPAVTVREPNLAITVTRTNPSGVGTAPYAGTVTITPTGTGCTQSYGPATATGGALNAPMPYGHYTVCATDSYHKVTSGATALLSKDPNGLTVPTLNLPKQSGSAGSASCP